MSTSPLTALIVADACGPLYFTVVLFSGIYGVTCMQTFYYYVHYPNDPRSLKIFVAVVWVLDTFHVALTIDGVYKYIMGGLESPVSLLADVPEIIIQGLVGTAAALPTQAFLVYRIYVLSGKSLVAPILWLIPAIYQIVAAVLYGVQAFYSSNGSLQVVSIAALDDPFFSNLIVANLVVAAAMDALIAISMLILLFRQRATTGFAGTLNILQLLTIFAVNTGLWTAVFSILSVILVHVYPESLVYGVFCVPLSALYSNAILANLNGRNYIMRQGRNMQDSAGAEMVIISHPPYGDTASRKESTRPISRVLLDIRKPTETVTLKDAESPTPKAQHDARS